jgi:WbqC-like protein
VKTILLHPTYFPSIAQMVAVVKTDELIFEIQDNYQKQSYRNRTYIAHANGRLLLNVPIRHSKIGNRQKTKEVTIENSFPWQLQHWKSLQSAYRTSPFFEFYEDDIAPIFNNPEEQLLELNLSTFKLLCELIGLEKSYDTTTEYLMESPQLDLRYLVEAKKQKNYLLSSYTQVMEVNHGFLPNLSVLDLLFNEGPNALAYLESQEIKF